MSAGTPNLEILRVGMWYAGLVGLKRETSTGFSRYYNLFMTIIIVTMMSTNVCFEFTVIISPEAPLLDKLEVLATIIPIMKCIMRTLSRYYWRHEVWHLRDRLQDEMFKSYEDKEKRQVFMKNDKSAEKLMKLYVKLFLTTMTFHAFLPFLVFVIKLILGKKAVLKHPFKTRFKDPTTVSYYLVYAIEIITVFCLASSGIYTGLFGCIGYFVVALFENVSIDLERLYQARRIDTPDKEMEVLKKVLKTHSHAIEEAKELNRLFSFQFGLDCTIGLTSLCLSMVQATLNKVVIARVSYAIYVIYIYVGLYFCMDVGQKLIDSSLKVREHIISLPWYDISCNYGKMMVQMLRCTAKPVVFVGGFFYTANFETFANLVKVNFSYLTLLQSFTEDMEV